MGTSETRRAASAKGDPAKSKQHRTIYSLSVETQVFLMTLLPIVAVVALLFVMGVRQ